MYFHKVSLQLTEIGFALFDCAFQNQFRDNDFFERGAGSDAPCGRAGGGGYCFQKEWQDFARRSIKEVLRGPLAQACVPWPGGCPLAQGGGECPMARGRGAWPGGPPWPSKPPVSQRNETDKR